MPRIDKAHSDALGNGYLFSHGARPEALQAGIRIRHGIDGLLRRQTCPGIFPGFPLGLLLLDMGTVLQHNAAQVGGLLRGVDPAPEAVLRQQGQQARVVNMGMGQQHKTQSRRD